MNDHQTIPGDCELLAQFNAQRDEDAFTQLVARHGPMVLGVCRRMLSDSHDAEDAGQQVFVTLAAKAELLGECETLAGWLHQVAWNVAMRFREKRDLRIRHEQQAAAQQAAAQTKLPGEEDAAQVVDHELEQLPDKIRLPLILHYLEGYTEQEVATLLTAPLGTISSRLNRGRETLRRRLLRRGVSGAAVLSLAALLKSESAAASICELSVDAVSIQNWTSATARVALEADATQLAASGQFAGSTTIATSAAGASQFKAIAVAALVAVVVGGGAFAVGRFRSRPAAADPKTDAGSFPSVEALANAGSRPLTIRPDQKQNNAWNAAEPPSRSPWQTEAPKTTSTDENTFLISKDGKMNTKLAATQAAMVIVIAASTLHGAETIEALEKIRIDRDAVAGQWSKSDNGLSVAASPAARCAVPIDVSGEYDLTIEFTRLAGDDAVGVALPIGGRQTVLELSGWKGEAHGLAALDKKPVKDPTNPTSVRPGRLENGKRHTVHIKVRLQDNMARIIASLDGRQIIDWSGEQSRLGKHFVIDMPSKSRVGLIGMNVPVEFHSVRLTFDYKNATPPDGTPLETILFEGRRFRTGLAQQVTIEKFQGRDALHVVGQEPAYIYLPEVDFQDGILEADIASATFSGLGFRGRSDGEKFEMIYFRPQNSGNAKHKNTVQYVAKGRDDGGWRYLRDNFPGKYEAGADMKTGQWFHVRLEIKGNRIRAFVDDAAEPVLVVEPMLYGESRGTVGLWSWDGYFSNFKFTPADAAAKP